MSANLFSVLAEPDLALLVATAREFDESGRPPATPRLAATVMLIRPDLSVFMMLRARTMVFGGRWAFPGGSADMSDAQVPPGPCYDPDAESAVARRAAVREVLEETGIDLDPARLIPWSRWITPEFEPRRFDTYFFIALTGTSEVTVETDEADATTWITAADSVERYDAGEFPMLLPTLVTMRELAECDTEASLRHTAATRDRSPILPRLP